MGEGGGMVTPIVAGIRPSSFIKLSQKFPKPHIIEPSTECPPLSGVLGHRPNPACLASKTPYSLSSHPIPY